jgi:hypothetical protein
VASADAVSSNHVPWIIIGACTVSCMALLFSIRVLLARENKRRDTEPRDDSYDDVYVARIDEKGNRVEVKVSKVRVRSHWALTLRAHVILILRTGILGFNGSSKSRF